MQFLDRFDPPNRERLLAAGRGLRLRRGEYLIRRGERGGDMYLVEEGAFEVVDTRASPEVLLAVFGPGVVLGEMAFVDEMPRTADVRAAEDGRVRHWEKGALMRVLQNDLAFAAAFYLALSSLTVERVRTLTAHAVVGAINRGGNQSQTGAALAGQGRNVAAHARNRWLEIEARLRRDPGDPGARQDVAVVFDELVREMGRWLRELQDPSTRQQAGHLVAQELRPHLARASLGQLALDRPTGRTGAPEPLAHVLLDEPQGDGVLGIELDRAMLAQPTCMALRRRTLLTAQTIISHLPAHPVRITLINAACGALLARLLPKLARRGAVVTAVDGSREALAFLDAGVGSRPPNVELRLVQMDLAELAVGRCSLHLGEQDFIVLDGLAEYLPDRVLASLIARLQPAVVPGGLVVTTAVGPSDDRAVFDHLLEWPLVRRTARSLRTLVEASGLHGAVVAGREGEPDPAVVVTGARRRPKRSSA